MRSLEFYTDRQFQCQKCGTIVKYGEQSSLIKVDTEKLGICPSCETEMVMMLDSNPDICKECCRLSVDGL